MAVWFEDQLLLIRNSYKRQLTFPAGGCKRNESAIQAAVRELREETGIFASENNLVHAGQFESYSEFKSDRSDVFELNLESKPSIQVDRREVVSFEFATLQDAKQRNVAPVVRLYLDTKLPRSDQTPP